MQATKAEILEAQIAILPDEDPDPSYLYQEGLGFEDRKEAYERGEFGYVGVRAEVRLLVNGTIQEISSPGLWGVESDSGEDYLRDIGKDESATLIDILKELGIDEFDAVMALDDVKMIYA
jgi:hypothetical protein